MASSPGAAAFKDAVRHLLRPVLRADGFTMRGERHATKVTPPVIRCLSVQAGRQSMVGSVCVELGVEFEFLRGGRAGGTSDLSASRLTAQDCELRARLRRPGTSDQWWPLEGGRAAVSDMCAIYESVGRDFFARFDEFPGHLRDAGLDDLGEFCNTYSLTRVRGAWFLARFLAHLGDNEGKREFAEHALAHIEASPSLMAGRGLIKPLRALLQS